MDVFDAPWAAGKHTLKRFFITLLKFGISFGILAWLFHQAWQNDQFEVLAATQKDYLWLTMALVFGVSASLVSFFRWYLLVRALELEFKFRDAVRLGFLGHLLNLMSFCVLGGDALKSVFLIRQLRGHAPESIASVLFDRAIGLLAMFTMASAAYLLTDFENEGLLHSQANAAFHFACQFAIVITVIGYVGLGTIFFAPHFRRSGIYRWTSRLPRVGNLFKRLVAVVLAYRSRFGVVLVALVLSLLVNVLFAATFFSIAAGISNQHPTFDQHLVLSPIAMVANAVPLPGGLGGMEFAVNFLYHALSSTAMPSEHGFVVALGFRIILLMTAGIGLIYYYSSRRELRELTKQQVPEL